MVNFHLQNFGCRASQADGAAIKKKLLDAGFEESASVEQCEVAVLNTCTVTATADAEVRQVIRRIRRANPRCRILVTGCYAQRAPEEIAQLPGVAWVVGNSHKHQVADLLQTHCHAAGEQLAHPCTASSGASLGLVRIEPGETAAQVFVGEIAPEFHFAPVFPDDRTRPTLKVQDGCNARCSFCIIPTVRGHSRSLTPEKVLDQVRSLVDDGYQEVVLSGINLGSYGKDFGRRITFLGLLERILAETSIARLRISSIEPMDVSPDLIRLGACEPRMAEHVHIPLQSGCDRILRLMNRRYWAAQYAERVLAVREAIPNSGIGADVMVGFPGETDQDHAASVQFIESLPFTYLHVFPYSARPMTPAAAIREQVDGRVVRERSREIRSVMATKRRGFLEAQVNRRLSVLTLDEKNQEDTVALSSNYLKVVLPGSAVSRNTLLNMRVGRVQGELLFGYPEAERPSSAGAPATAARAALMPRRPRVD